MNSKRTKYSGITSAGSNIAHILQRDGGTRSVGIHGTRTVRVQKRREFCNDITQVMSNHWGVGVGTCVYRCVGTCVCVCVCVCIILYCAHGWLSHCEPRVCVNLAAHTELVRVVGCFHLNNTHVSRHKYVRKLGSAYSPHPHHLHRSRGT